MVGIAELATRRSGVTERGMEARREAEPDAGLLDATRDAGGIELERDAERFEEVRGTARRRRGAVAVLAHGHASARDDER